MSTLSKGIETDSVMKNDKKEQKSMSKAWPAHFPEGCPPNDALETDHQVFRFIRGDAIEPTDFHSEKERHPDRDYARKECMASGVSVQPSLEGVREIREAVAGFKRMKLAKGTLVNGDGRIRHTPTGHSTTHHTWWLSVNVNPLLRFVLVEIDVQYN